MRRHIGECALIAGLICAIAGCSGGGGSSSTTTTTIATVPAAPVTTTTCKTGQSSTAANPCTKASAVQGAIAHAWVTFFDGGTPVAQRVALLAGGSRFSSTIKSLSSNPLASKTSATVSKVKVTGPTTADVTFTVYLAGLPVLKNATGTAVLENGHWLVGAASLCKLLQLQGSKPSACVTS